MKDVDVRTALDRLLFDRYRAQPDTRVVHELGLRSGNSRVDVAVINGLLHGFEIKSSADRLDRLPAQVEAYGEVLDKVTLIVADKHLERALSIIPLWWGVRRVFVDNRGELGFRLVRPDRTNRHIVPLALAELLWRDEAASILAELDAPKAVLLGTRLELHSRLVETLSLRQLRRLVRAHLRSREGWRDRRVPALCDD